MISITGRIRYQQLPDLPGNRRWPWTSLAQNITGCLDVSYVNWTRVDSVDGVSSSRLTGVPLSGWVGGRGVSLSQHSQLSYHWTIISRSLVSVVRGQCGDKVIIRETTNLLPPPPTSPPPTTRPPVA